VNSLISCFRHTFKAEEAELARELGSYVLSNLLLLADDLRLRRPQRISWAVYSFFFFEDPLVLAKRFFYLNFQAGRVTSPLFFSPSPA